MQEIDALQLEVTQLIGVCERLHRVATDHPTLQAPLDGIAESISNCATLLDVFISVRMSN